MYSRISLNDLIAWLSQQNPDLVVQDGFGAPHSDRGAYEDLAFDPLPETRIGDMLKHAQSAMGQTFQGYKGGDYEMDGDSRTYIGQYGECGEAITSIHFKFWLLTARAVHSRAA